MRAVGFFLPPRVTIPNRFPPLRLCPCSPPFFSTTFPSSPADLVAAMTVFGYARRWLGADGASRPSDQLRVAEISGESCLVLPTQRTPQAEKTMQSTPSRAVEASRSIDGGTRSKASRFVVRSLVHQNPLVYAFESCQYDRQWMIVTEDRHRFVTARENPKMLLIGTAIDLDHPAGPQLIITIPKTASNPSATYSLPTAPAHDAPYSADYSIWASPPCDGYDVGADNGINDALSAYCGFRVCLILKGPEPRTCGNNYAVEALDLPLTYDVEDERTLPPFGLPGKQAATRWADGYPFLLTTRESEADVKRMVEDPCNVSFKGWDSSKWGIGGTRGFDPRRFRANIISEGANGPWEEDGWLEVKIGNHHEDRWSTLFPVSRCGRCMVPNTDPETAERDAVVPFNIMKPTRAVGETVRIHSRCLA